jgi:hypothetical protein
MNLQIPLPTKTHTGTVRYSERINGSATLTIKDDQTFDLVMQDGSNNTASGQLYAVTNCGETTVVVRISEPGSSDPSATRTFSARACINGENFSLTSLGAANFSFQTPGSARGGTPFELGRCK